MVGNLKLLVSLGVLFSLIFFPLPFSRGKGDEIEAATDTRNHSKRLLRVHGRLHRYSPARTSALSRQSITNLIARYRLLFLLAGSCLLFSFVHSAHAQTAPPGFVIENPFPTATFDLPTQIVFLNDGRKLVAEKGGVVWTITSGGSQLATPFIDLSTKVLSNFDRGLMGVALDPDFGTNRWVYFLYVVDPDSNGNDDNTVAFCRLERYRASLADPNVADLSTRQILIGGSWSTGIPHPGTEGSHTIGTLRFGRDKTLLVGSGDAAHFGTTDAGGLDPAAFGSGKTNPLENLGHSALKH